MDVSQLIQQKLSEFGMDQRDLADAADVTESYISQLLNRKKTPPAPERTDIYDKLGRLLKLPAGKLAGLADIQRKQELKKKIQSPPVPLFKEVRELVLQKCKRQRRRVFEKEPFGELERLITQKLMDVVKALVKEELERENWLRILARESNRSYKQIRVAVLEFLDTDVFNITPESCIAFLDSLIMSPEEIDFLRHLRFKNSRHLRFKNSRHPTPLYYYRELQNLRAPLHFRRK